MSIEPVKVYIQIKYASLLAVLGVSLAISTPEALWAVPIERSVEGESFKSMDNGVIVITTGGNTYTVTPLPLAGYELEFSINPSQLKRSKVVKNLDYGIEISDQEIDKVIDIYFKNVAYDYESIRLRNVSIHPRQYAVWCNNPVLFGICELGWQGRAGAPVYYDSDGKNLSGARTGYTREALMIRKVAKAN